MGIMSLMNFLLCKICWGFPPHSWFSITAIKKFKVLYMYKCSKTSYQITEPPKYFCIKSECNDAASHPHSAHMTCNFGKSHQLAHAAVLTVSALYSFNPLNTLCTITFEDSWHRNFYCETVHHEDFWMLTIWTLGGHLLLLWLSNQNLIICIYNLTAKGVETIK